MAEVESTRTKLTEEEIRARKAARKREWRKKNPEKWRAANKKWDTANKEKMTAYHREYTRQWLRENPDKAREYKQRTKVKNPEGHAKSQKKQSERRKLLVQVSPEYRDKCREHCRRNYEENKSDRLQKQKAYYAKNREARLAYNREYAKTPNGQAARVLAEQRRRAKKKGNGGNVTRKEWFAVVAAHGSRCYYCGMALVAGVSLTMDHKTAISKGGKHSPENVIPACRPCNSRKNARSMEEFLEEISRCGG